MSLPPQNKDIWVGIYDTVQWFADRMLHKLWVHRDKRFWIDHPDFSIKDARARLAEELAELDDELEFSDDTRDHQAVVYECADIANFAMMIAHMTKVYHLDKTQQDEVQ